MEIISQKKIIKIKKNKEIDCKDYSFDKLLKWNLSEKITKNYIYWFDIESPSKQDLLNIKNKFNIENVTMDEIINQNTREKIKYFEKKNYFHVVLKDVMYIKKSNEYDTLNINILIFNNIILTLHDNNDMIINKIIERIIPINKDYKEGKLFDTLAINSKDWIIIALLELIVEMFENFVEQIIFEGKALDELVFFFSHKDQDDLLLRISQARRMLNFIDTALWEKYDFLQTLMTFEPALVNEKFKSNLTIIKKKIMKFEKKLIFVKKVLNNSYQTYISRISYEVANTSKKMSLIMKIFSIISTIFIPLNIISSLFGMNVRVPFQSDYDDSLAPFFIIISLMILYLGVISAFLVILRKYL